MYQFVYQAISETICGEQPNLWVAKMTDLNIPIGDISDFANKVRMPTQSKGHGLDKFFSLKRKQF